MFDAAYSKYLFLQKLIGAFESLRFQAEADQQEMQKGLFLFVHHALLHNHFIHLIYSGQALFVIRKNSKLHQRHLDRSTFNMC